MPLLEQMDSPKLEGVFWLPEHEDRRWPGVVQILDGGITRVTLWQLGEYARTPWQPDPFSFHRPTTLHGELDDLVRRYITVQNCLVRVGPATPQRLGGSVVLEADLAVFWLSLDRHPADEAIAAKEFFFLLEGVEDWLGTRLWDIEGGEHGVSYKARKHPEITGIPVATGVHASLRVLAKYDIVAPGLKVDTVGQVALNSSALLGVRQFSRLAERFQKFFCFALGRPCLIKEMYIARDGGPAASVCCPTWLSGFSSVKPSRPGALFRADDVGPGTTPGAVLENWCRLCSDSEDVVESIVRLLADSRSTDRRADLVVPALDKLADNVGIEEPDSRRIDRERMLRVVEHSEHLPEWRNALRWNPNPLRARLEGMFSNYLGDRVDASKQSQIIGELIDFRNRRFHRGFREVPSEAWYHAVAVLYFCVVDNLGMDWRPLMSQSGTLAER